MADRFRNRSIPRSAGRGYVRKTVWAGTAEASVTWTVVGVSAKVILLSTTPTEPLTVIRNRALLGVKSDQFAASEVQMGAFGLAVVSTDALNAGAASVPGPMSDPSFGGWMLFEPFSQDLKVGSQVGIEPKFGDMRNADSKAMRKIDDGESLVLVYESGQNSLGVSVFANLRTLSKLY